MGAQKNEAKEEEYEGQGAGVKKTCKKTRNHTCFV